MAPKSGRPAPNLFAKATTKLVLATTIAAFSLTVAPITGAAANGQISAARAAAIHECSLLAARYPLHDWVTPKSICIGPAWPGMANKNEGRK